MRIEPASDSSVIVIFGDAITREFHGSVVQLFHGLRALNDSRIRNIHPAYASVLVDFDPLRIRHGELIATLEKLVHDATEMHAVETRTVEIPVCYEPEFAPDLAAVADHVHLSVEEVVHAHSSAGYFVSFLGFSPGFAYLGGLPAHLAVPRLATPRRLVTAGSVGIAGSQTGVYPLNSPGGWRLIGRTPLRMFDPLADPPTRLQLGDEVRFVPVSRERFFKIAEIAPSMASERSA